jgi:4-amino-4-deoxy-L-arabinose transferase-like glycosyltransferase
MTAGLFGANLNLKTMPRPLPSTALHPTAQSSRTTFAWMALLVLAVLIYAAGLGGQYNPTNGDELVYTHIARLTAASNHWLPLVSDLDHMRNTKPPLLFWQAMVAGDWGNHWTMAALRTPSLIYTLLIAAAVAWTAHQITKSTRTACLAACVYLAFFCTYRYGRTFLTSAPESFWFNVPLFYLLWFRLRQAPGNDKRLGWTAHSLLGIALGLGLAYKSFALIAPAAATFWCAQLMTERSLNWQRVISTTLKVSLSACLALGIFALWFVLDPDPAAVWQEFVVGENAGKMSSRDGYWHVALMGGGGSMWAQLLAYAQNAGLLALVVLGLAWVGLKRGILSKISGPMPTHLLILLVWLAVWLVVFTLPSQRSARYVIPAMPALALLIALYWDRIGRGWFVASLLLSALFMGILGRIAWAGHEVGIGSDAQLNVNLLVVALGFGAVACGFWRPAWTRACTLVACFAVYTCFGLTTAPLNGASGSYDASTVLKTQGLRIAVPSSFNAQFERFGFLLPGNTFVPYDGENRATPGNPFPERTEALNRLLARHDAVAWLQADPAELSPPCMPNCQLLGTRWEIKGRHQPGEITLANLWTPQSWLFRREWLITRLAASANASNKP